METDLAGVNRCVDEYLTALSKLDAGVRQSIANWDAITTICPEAFLALQGKGSPLIPVFELAGKISKDQAIERLRSKSKSDRHLLDLVVKQLGFEQARPGIEQTIISIGKKLCTFVAKNGWGGADALNEFLAFQNFITSRMGGNKLLQMIADARMQAQKFQVFAAIQAEASQSSPSGTMTPLQPAVPPESKSNETPPLPPSVQRAWSQYQEAIQHDLSLASLPLASSTRRPRLLIHGRSSPRQRHGAGTSGRRSSITSADKSGFLRRIFTLISGSPRQSARIIRVIRAIRATKVATRMKKAVPLQGPARSSAFSRKRSCFMFRRFPWGNDVPILARPPPRRKPASAGRRASGSAIWLPCRFQQQSPRPPRQRVRIPLGGLFHQPVLAAVRSKGDTAMKNEVLAKLLCHNICCLISAIYELGIEPMFWRSAI